MVLITSHINADFDAFASAMAAQKIYPGAVVCFPGSLERKVRDFVEAFRPMEIKRVKDIPLDEVTRLIVVDTKHPDRIGQFKALLDRPGIEVHIYDHHPAGEEDIHGEQEVMEHVGAVSTIFAEMIQEREIPITPLEATILCLGIYEETGSLIYPSTTPRDLTAVAFLLRRGANLKILSGFLREEMSREEFTLINDLLQSLKEVVVHGVIIKIGTARMEGFEDVSHLAHRIMDMEDTDALIILVGMEDKLLMVARSKVGELNVAQLLAEFGGGGHPSAASATVKDMPLEILEESLTEAIRRHVRPLKVARDVMTTPVITITAESRIREAGEMMTRYGVNVLPVVRDEKYLGIISRELVVKALFHGFGESRCEDFATIDAITTSPETPVSEVESSMIEQNQRFVPVIEDERITGAITRTDLLRSLYEDSLRKGRISSKEYTEVHGMGRNIGRLLRERLPAPFSQFLSMAGSVADELGFGAYLVGGCVRDLLRGEENLDIDIVVEGNGVALAKTIAERMEARVIVHQRFGTAQVIKGAMKLDVATARTEYYESPAALPHVEMSSIKKDLYRRDFTINTLALKLNKKDFGLLIDFFGGQRDIKDRVVRVLHNLSFIEDPTRAFRAVRFAERFGFKLTKHTENLIRLAIRMEIFDKLSGTRIYDEMVLIFSETDPIKTIRRLAEQGLLQVIHRGLSFSPALEGLLQSVHDTISWFDLLFLKEGYDKGILYTLALLSKLGKDERDSALERLKVPFRLQERLRRIWDAAGEISMELPAEDPVGIYHALQGREMETILFTMAQTQDQEKKRAISRFLLELRQVKPLLTGKELKAMGIPPGPAYSLIFRQILEERLRNRLETKEEEAAFVRTELISLI
ncbi:MAG: CBS domain-containing protein [Thermodesulfovibrionales bacterium]|jgi:tRNA nucleotidyltransferase (CCA-adding enzyme)